MAISTSLRTWLDDCPGIEELPSFNIDFRKQIVGLLKLLHVADTLPFGGLYQGIYAQEAVRRYEQCWLPLLAKAKDAVDSSPPPDVAFVWYLHRLHPEWYSRDFEAVLRCEPVYPSPNDSFAFTTNCSAAWRQHCGSEAFWPPSPSAVAKGAGLRSRLSVNLLADMHQSKGFLKQVLRRCYLDPFFVDQAVLRYKRIIMLATDTCNFATGSSSIVVPPDVVLAWRAHAASSPSYRADADALQLPPFFTMQPYSVDHITQFQDMAANYEATFNAPFVVPGSSHVQSSLQHPAEALLPGLNQLLGEQHAERAGAHALYALWLLDKGYKKLATKLACVKCPTRRQDAALKYLARKARGWQSWRNLPHSSTHPYWDSFVLSPRAPAPAPELAATCCSHPGHLCQPLKALSREVSGLSITVACCACEGESTAHSVPDDGSQSSNGGSDGHEDAAPAIVLGVMGQHQQLQAPAPDIVHNSGTLQQAVVTVELHCREGAAVGHCCQNEVCDGVRCRGTWSEPAVAGYSIEDLSYFGVQFKCLEGSGLTGPNRPAAIRDLLYGDLRVNQSFADKVHLAIVGPRVCGIVRDAGRKWCKEYHNLTQSVR